MQQNKTVGTFSWQAKNLSCLWLNYMTALVEMKSKIFFYDFHCMMKTYFVFFMFAKNVCIIKNAEKRIRWKKYIYRIYLGYFHFSPLQIAFLTYIKTSKNIIDIHFRKKSFLFCAVFFLWLKMKIDSNSNICRYASFFSVIKIMKF